jgi:CRISP-associated protein Cas1
MQGTDMKNLQELPKFDDKLSYLYVEHVAIDQSEKSIAVHDAEGATPVPAASLGVLILGPGTRITHAAVAALADNNCQIIWAGEHGVRFYAHGMGGARSSRNLIRQARLVSNDLMRLQVVIRMYCFRFEDPVDDGLTLQQIRGKEGIRVRQAYADASRATGVPWHGRNYQRQEWNAADPVNRALSAANSCLYGLVHAAIISGGYSPALGFVHTGKQLSFVYDVADLYKADVTIPLAFRVVAQAGGAGVAAAAEVAAEAPATAGAVVDEAAQPAPAAPLAKPAAGGLERAVRIACRECFRTTRLVERILPDIQAVLDVPDAGQDEFAEDEARPAELWTPKALTVDTPIGQVLKLDPDKLPRKPGRPTNDRADTGTGDAVSAG